MSVAIVDNRARPVAGIDARAFTGSDARPRRGRIGLTPMVDVVFLLLVFFMLAASVGEEARVLPLAPGGGGEAEAAPAYAGAPRLVTVSPEGLALNGSPVAPEALAAALAPLMPHSGAAVILRPVEGASLQRTVGVLDRLRESGIRTVVLAE
ncbi:MAG: ExbD/TolR family protein [Paracoccaceae bacterium]